MSTTHHHLIAPALAATLALLSSSALAQTAGAQRLAWLQGCWRIDAGNRVVEEQWSGVVFENLQHDFPQRVAYRRKGEELLAWIEGPAKNAPGQLRRIEYPYRKVGC